MKLAQLGLLALLTLGPTSFADNHECKCDQKCEQSCSKGDHKDCDCKCGCKEGKCKHGKCHDKADKK